MSADFDVSEITALSVVLAGSLTKFPAGAKAVVSKGALTLKQGMKAEARSAGVAEAKALASTIDYDTKALVGSITAEVGPKGGGPGSFAFLYYGNSKNGPLIPDPVILARAEGEVVAGFLSKLAAESLA